MKRDRRGVTALIAFAVAAALTLLAGLGVLNQADLAVSDAWYQGQIVTGGETVLVAIDQRALEEIGPYSPWGRNIFAAILENLNVSEETRPAVIAIDTIFGGTTDPELDRQLTEAAGRYDNVVSACVAEFAERWGEPDENGEVQWNDFDMLAFEEPFEDLRAVTTVGHINTMLDNDGILRHNMLQITVSGKDGERDRVIPSLSLAAVQKYREYIGGEKISLPPTNSRGFWYLPFSGLPEDFYEGISAADVLSGAIDPSYFAGRIVFIGPYATGLQDSYLTSIDHAKPMYGVEVHINAAHALLRGEYKQEVGNPLQLALLFVTLLLAFAGFWKRSVKVSTALWLVLCGGWLGLTKALYGAGWVWHVLWIPVGVSILYVSALAANYIQANMERRRVTSTFQRYVDPSVIQELLREGSDNLELGGKMTDIAVLFVDIRGFTTMSEILTPHQIVEILNQYLTLTTRCVMDNHGTLDKFVGDCTMAIWNAPLPQEDYVMNACKAAMAMVKGSKPLAEKLEKEFGRTVSFGVGVHVGPAVVGNIGAPMRMDYTAIGDTVNTSARLEANAPGGVVYISRAVADALGDRIRATPLEKPIHLKGKAEGFEILTLDEIPEMEETV